MSSTKRAVFTPPPKEGLPHQEEAERAVLAGLMIDQTYIPVIRTLLAWQDFFFERHQLVFQACLRVADRSKPVDSLTVLNDLESSGLLAAAGGYTYLSSMVDDLPDLGRLADYAGIVAEHARLRELIDLAGRTIKHALEPGTAAVQDILARTEKELRILSSGAASPSLVAIGTTLRETVAAVEDRHDRGAKDLYGLPTGLRALDRATEGLVGGELIIIAGRPGMGKTSLALKVAEHAAVDLHQYSAVFSLEMGTDELNLRLLAQRADVPFTQLRKAVLSRNQWARVHEAERVLAAAPLLLSTNPRINVAQLCAAIRRQHMETPLAVAVVDYLQLMVTDSNKRQEMVGAASRELKLLAMELKIPVIAVSQLSRETERSSDGRPKLWHLRESGSLEQDADMVLFTYHEGEYSPDDPSLAGAATLIIAKHRNGEKDVDVPVCWVGPVMAFRNLDLGAAPF